ncbi:MAG TPA: hypothetical protein VMM84_15075 [Pyrinomonadaceae bacterium]|nr:hypothetical protein [Pyrinomonadaceae bacterium]
MTFDEKFLALGDAIPPLVLAPAESTYSYWRRCGNLLFLSGHAPRWGRQGSSDRERLLLGLQATAGNLAGAISPLVAGVILARTGSFDGVFYFYRIVALIDGKRGNLECACNRRESDRLKTSL